MGYWNSFDCQVQCEEVFLPLPGLFQEDPESEDILDRCEVVSLEGLKSGNRGGSYRMEEEVIDELELSELWDYNTDAEYYKMIFGLRRVGM